MGQNNNCQWRGSCRGRDNAGGRNNRCKKRKEREIKFATQEQMQRGYYATYTVASQSCYRCQCTKEVQIWYQYHKAALQRKEI